MILFQLEISLDARDGEGKNGDWWLVANAPTGGLQSYDLTTRGFYSRPLW